MTFSCEICKKAFASKASVNTHRSRFHKGKKRTQTGKDPIDHLRLYSSGKTPREILNDHLDDNKDDYDEEEWKNLKRKAEHGVPEPKIPRFNDWACSLCSARFDNEREHDLHVAEEHPTCLECRKQFPDRKEYDKHTHPECHVCKKTFPTDGRLNKHLMSHPKCDQCDKLFLNEAKLGLHKMTKHGQRRAPAARARSRSRSPRRRRVSSDDNESGGMDSETENSDDDSRRGFTPREPRAGSHELSDEASESVKTVDLDEDGEDPEQDLDEYEEEDLETEQDLDEDEEEEDTEQELDEDEEEDLETLKGSDDDGAQELSSDDRSSVKTEDSIPSSQLRKCPKCPLKFASQALLNKHLKTHVGSKPKSKKRKTLPSSQLRKCPKCYLKFTSQALLNKHLKTHSRLKPTGHKRHHVCHYCGKHLPSQQSLVEHVESKHPKREHSKTVYQCGICKDILKTKEGYEEHIRNHQRYECSMCAARFDSNTERAMHMSLNHPRCTLCDQAFATTDEYVRHRQRDHPEPPPELSIASETEDEEGSDEDDLDVKDRLFHKHINCVTIERFLEIRDLINQNAFDTLFNDDELLEGLQIIFKGVIKGYIPICTAQRMVLSPSMRKLIFNFVANPSGALLNRNKKNLKQLFQILWESVNTVINSFMKYV